MIFRARTKQMLCVLVTLGLLIASASVALSLPLPLLQATRTQVMPTLKPPVAVGDRHTIEGMVVHFEDFSITTSSDTTAAMYLGGLVPWRIINESGGAATLTFYDARTLDGTALSLFDSDDLAIAAITIGDDESEELPTGIAGCTWLVITGAVAADDFTLVCKR